MVGHYNLNKWSSHQNPSWSEYTVFTSKGTLHIVESPSFIGSVRTWKVCLSLFSVKVISTYKHGMVWGPMSLIRHLHLRAIGVHSIWVYLSIIQHKTLHRVCNPKVIFFNGFDIRTSLKLDSIWFMAKLAGTTRWYGRAC